MCTPWEPGEARHAPLDVEKEKDRFVNPFGWEARAAESERTTPMGSREADPGRGALKDV